jgi:demethylmenaquinone methyltransferase/2-methoxy-6-polyprenyl-1,4-benzoquinol methylase
MHTSGSSGSDSVADRLLFDRLAGLYDLVMPPADAAALRAGLALAERDPARAVDLGGGPGRGARALPELDWTVVDLAPGMLRRARARGLAAVRGDATRLPLVDDAVDAVIVVDALHHMPDHATVLAEVARVLRPGGVVVVREFDPRTVRGRALVAAEGLVRFGSTFRTPAALASVVSEAGLDATVVDEGFGYTVAGVV